MTLLWCWLALFTGYAQAAESGPEDVAARPALLASHAMMLGTALAGDRLVAVGEHGIVLLSDDGGQHWRQAQAVPTRTTLTAVRFVSPQQGWTVGHGGQILATTDGGEHWLVQYGKIDGENSLFSLWMDQAGHGIAVGSYGRALATSDAGKSWQEVSVGEGENGERHLNQLLADAKGRLYIMAETGVVYLSDDLGATWRTVQTPYEGSLWSGLVRADGSVIALGMAGHALVSVDRGETWRELDTHTGQSLTTGAELPDGRLVFAGLGGGMSVGNAQLEFRGFVRDDRQAVTALLPAGQRLLLFTQSGMLDYTPPAP